MASLGASLSLLVAGSLALMTVSAVVAFQGWPGIESAQTGGEAGTLLAATSDRDAARAAQREAIVLPRRAQVRRPAAKRPAHTHATTNVPAATARVTPKSATATPTKTQPATSAQAKAPSGQTAPKPKPTAGDPVRKVGTDLGTAVQETGTQLGGVLANVSPGLGEVVESVTNLLAGVVDGTSQVLGKTLDELARPRHR